MLIKQMIMAFIGLSAGGIVAAGVFAFLAIIGIYPRLIGKTNTSKHIFLYETLIILGGILGNLVSLYEIPILFGGHFFLSIYGGSVGIFVGCLVMSLAETLKALPVITRRIHLAVGLQYLIFSIAFGKVLGGFIYFVGNFR